MIIGASADSPLQRHRGRANVSGNAERLITIVFRIMSLRFSEAVLLEILIRLAVLKSVTVGFISGTGQSP